MTLQELLEHAHLDALGQLDEREQAAFEAAFAVAPPAIRAQVRAEQARWAPMEELLPQVEPSPDLRERVLSAVTAAMVAQGAGELTMRPSRRVAPAWRAASIGLMTAMVVLGSAFVYVYQTNVKSDLTKGNDLNMEYLLQAFKGNVKSAVLSPQTVRTAFVSPTNDPKCQGSLWTNDAWTQVVAFIDLPRSAESEEYRIVMLDDAGKVLKLIDTFESNNVLKSREFNNPGHGKLAVVSAVKGSKFTAMKDVLLTVT